MNKRLAGFILPAVCLLMLISCTSAPRLDIPRENIARISINTQPGSDTYAREYTDAGKIGAVIDYLNGLSLTSRFPENPDEYAGMAYIITIRYDDGASEVYNHFGNMFFGRINADSIDWYRMKYDEAEALSGLIQQNPSDE